MKSDSILSAVEKQNIETYQKIRALSFYLVERWRKIRENNVTYGLLEFKPKMAGGKYD